MRNTRNLVMAFIVSFILIACINTASADVLSIPEFLEVIGTRAFFNNTSLERVVLPPNIERIESEAFAYSGIRRINLPDSLAYIADDAFVGCWNVVYTGVEDSYADSYCARKGYMFVPYEEPVASVQIMDTSIELLVGESRTLTTNVLPSNASCKDLYFFSSNSCVLVDDTGTIYASESGSAVITAMSADGSRCYDYSSVIVREPLSIYADADTRSIVSKVANPSGTVYITGGKAPYSISYTWHADGYAVPQQRLIKSGITGNTARWECGPCNNSEGSFHVDVTCTDSEGSTAAYTINGFSMRADFSVTSNSLQYQVNQDETMDGGITITVAGNYPPYSIRLSLRNRDNVIYEEQEVTGLSSVCIWVPMPLDDPGVYYLHCNCTDSTGTWHNSILASLNVTAPVTGLTLNKYSHNLDVGQTVALAATVSPYNAADKSILWSSSNTSVASVSTSGVVTARAAGVVDITASAKDGSKVSASCRITIRQPVQSIAVSADNPALYLGSGLEHCYVSAVVSPNSATNKNYVWSSSNASVATVDSTGKVTAVAPGTATIRATASDGSGVRGSCTITVGRYTKMSLSFRNVFYFDEFGYYVCDMSSLQSRMMLYEGDTAYWEIGVSGGVAPYSTRFIAASLVGLPDYYDTGYTSRLSLEWKIPKGMTTGYTMCVQVRDATGAVATIGGYHDTLTMQIKLRIRPYVPPVTTNKRIQLRIGETKNLDSRVLNTVDIRTIANDNPTVVSNDDLRLTANKAGTAVIKVSSRRFGVTETYTVTVLPERTTVTLSTQEATVLLSQSTTLALSASVNSAYSSSASATWSSSNTAVATVNSSTGLVSCKAAGTTVITVTANDGSGVEASCTVNVYSAPTIMYTSQPNTATTDTRGMNLSVRISGGKGPYNCTWKLYKGSTVVKSNSVNSVTSPNVTWVIDRINAVGTYDVLLSVTDSLGQSCSRRSASIVVSAPTVKVTKINMSSAIEMKLGDAVTLTTSIMPSNASNPEVKLSSSNTSVASVNHAGVIISKSPGTTVITATATDGSGVTATCTVTVYTKPTITFSSYPTSVTTASAAVTIPASVAGGKRPYTCYWTVYKNGVKESETVSYQLGGNTDSISERFKSAGVYQVAMTIDDALGQEATGITASISVSNPALTITSMSLSSTSISAGSKMGQILLQGSGGVPPYSASVSILNSSGVRVTGGSASGQQSIKLEYKPAYVFNVAGSYTVNAVVTDATGVSAIKTASFTVTGGTVTQGPTPTVTAADNGTVTFKWNGIANAIEYDLYIFPGSVYPSDSTWSRNIGVVYLGADKRSHSKSFGNGTYYVWMAAVGTGSNNWKYGTPVRFVVGDASSSVANYKPALAVAYAQKWAKSRNTSSNGGIWANYGATGVDALDVGGDCANFVSQCLFEGGLPMDESSWYWYSTWNYASSWTVAPKLREYLNSLSYGKKPSNISDISLGDIVWINSNGNTYGHVMIVTGIDGNRVLICGHSIDQYNSDYSVNTITWVWHAN